MRSRDRELWLFVLLLAAVLRPCCCRHEARIEVRPPAVIDTCRQPRRGPVVVVSYDGELRQAQGL